MATKKTITETHCGYNYTVWVGCNLDSDGRAIKSTADYCIGGWAPFKSVASSHADSEIDRLTNNIDADVTSNTATAQA